jgi:hypothetical protein
MVKTINNVKKAAQDYYDDEIKKYKEKNISPCRKILKDEMSEEMSLKKKQLSIVRGERLLKNDISVA